MKTKTTFLVSGALGLLICGGAWIEARSFPFQSIDAGLGPAFFPYLLLGCLLVLSVGMIAYGVMTHSGDHVELPGLDKLRVPALLFAVMVAFGLSLAWTNAVFGTFVFLFLSMIVLGEIWKRAIAYAAAITALIYLLFGVGFGLSIFSW